MSVQAEAVARIAGELARIHNADDGIASMTWLNHWSVQRVIDDPAATESLRGFTFVGVDGVALRHAVGGRPPRTSADLIIPHLLPHLRSPRLMVVGGSAATNRAASQRLLAMNTDARLVAAFDGYENLPASMDLAMRAARKHSPTAVIVGLGAGLQEQFALAFARGMASGIVLTCGGYLDQVVQNHYYPRWAYPLRLNWLVRLAREPQRLWRRYTIDAATALMRRSTLHRYLAATPGFIRYRAVTRATGS